MCLQKWPLTKAVITFTKYIADFGIKLPPQYAEIIRTLCFTLSNNTSETEGSEANTKVFEVPLTVQMLQQVQDSEQ